MSKEYDHLTTESRARRNVRMAAYSQLCIKHEYTEHGEEPVSSAGMLISRSLVEVIRRQSRALAQIPPTRSDGR
ncbi:MAG: hypothetical protein IT537_03390 [Hyphomicrobiales bacterium]|nr:hypothetical protein [Hyphomicrobiales bacterium]